MEARGSKRHDLFFFARPLLWEALSDLILIEQKWGRFLPDRTASLSCR